MKTLSPPLLPIFRSRAQAEILGLVLWSAPTERSLTELAQRTGVSLATVQREVERSEQAGIVVSRRVGNVRLVKSAESRDAELLAELLLRSFGPKQVVAEEFAHVKGIEQIIIFGSWAARYAGVVGQAPNDIDVLVLGKPNYSQLSEACARAQDRVGKQINAIDRGMSWWTTKSTDLLKKEIKRRPDLTI